MPLKLLTHTFELPLKHAFTISRETTEVQPTLIVELSDGTHSGFGEATTNTYYDMTLQRMQDALQSVKSLVESIDELSPESLWTVASKELQD
ncbi:MAG: dipeptide epimerase, partial [Lacipirellulaceae bacterium]